MTRIDAESVRMFHVGQMTAGNIIVVSLNGIRFRLTRAQAQDMALLLGAALLED